MIARRTIRLTLLAYLPALFVTPPTVITAQNPEAVFAQRGYYFTFCRMPNYGLAEWRDIIDCVHEDNGNTVILWMGGAFRSQAHPITWEYNRDHKNVQADFVRELIDYAHTQGIRVLLGITPYGYDGVNQYYKVNPETIATQLNGDKAKPFGIHSWGYNMCAANWESRLFMLKYVHEMMRDFYPNSDGLLIESSDYAVCYCDDCGERFFDHEFQLVREISDDIWSGNPNATILVYPRYFVDDEVPELGVPGSRYELDPRWSLFFTPHSAHLDKELISKAKSSIWWDDSPALRRPQDVQRNARIAQAAGVSGYVPSLETFSYFATQPEEGQSWLRNRRHVPLGMGWLAATEHPYRELPIRLQRSAYRIYANNPNASDEQFHSEIGREYFDSRASGQNIDDLLTIQEVFAEQRTWYQPSPVVSVDRCRALQDAGALPPEVRERYLYHLTRLREIAQRYEHSEHETEKEMRRLIGWVLSEWDSEALQLLSAE